MVDNVHVSIRHINKVYDDGTKALKDINLDIHEGEIVGSAHFTRAWVVTPAGDEIPVVHIGPVAPRPLSNSPKVREGRDESRFASVLAKLSEVLPH